MARPCASTAHLCLLLVTIFFHAATAISYSSYSSLCHFPVPSPDLHTGNHSHSPATARNNLPRISTGHFSGGDDLLFIPERSYAARSFSFITRHSSLTTDPAVVRLVATLALEGFGVGSRRREFSYSVTFELEGYYYSTTTTSYAELCMIGSGSYARDDGTDTDVLLSDVGLRFRLPRTSSLVQPFVTGRLEGVGFGAIVLVAYVADSRSDTDGGYTYAETAAACPPPVTPARDGEHVLSAGFSCSRLRTLLRGSYDLEYMPGTGTGMHAAGSSPLQLRHRRVYINKMSCAADGGVRAYMAFYANQLDSVTSSWFLVGDEALVAEGFWDAPRSQLCLRACRVVRSGADLAVGECGIGVSFWFPDTWSFQDRRTVAGLIWNSSRTIDGDTMMMSGARLVLTSMGMGYTGTGDLSDMKYSYTLVEKAKEHFHSNPVLSKHRNGRFPGNHSCRDFVFRINLKKQGLRGYGSASPVTIGSAVVLEDRPMPDDEFSRRVAAEVNTQRLVNVSYVLQYRVADVKWHIDAEGVYDTKTGSLCMVACQVGNGSSDCQVLLTVQFAPLDTDEDRERTVGTISSLRRKGDPLFFETVEFTSQGVMPRMETEIIMLELSPALFAVVLILQLRHANKHPEAVPSMSITMLAVLGLGSLVLLMLDFEPAIRALENRFDPQWTWYSVELNKFPLRVGTMLAFLLQLRLLQLALSGRRPMKPGHGGDGSSTFAAERRTLQACLLLHFLGAVLMLIANRDRGDGLPRLLVLIDATDPTPADVLVSYGGMVLDGFLLPQVIWNAFSGAKASALSPWFYVGGTVIRAAPRAYDVYAGPHGNLAGGVALDAAVLFGMALLAALLFLQQRVRLRGACMCSSSKGGQARTRTG